MAVSFVAVNAAAGQVAGVTTPAGVTSITPTLSVRGTVANPNRVFIGQAHSCATGSAATPSGFTVLGTKDTLIGTGAPSSGGGQRWMTIYYQDDDGSWSMPAFDLASATQNSHAIALVTLLKDPTESWDTPTISEDGEYFGTAGTAFSAATPSTFSTTTGALLMAFSCTNDNVTSTAGAITGSGFVSGTVTERVDGGTATGNDVAVKLHTCQPTTGANVALTHTQTLSAASQGGWLAVQQTVTYSGSNPASAFVYDNFRDTDAKVLTSHTGELGATWAGQPGWGGNASTAIQSNRVWIGSGGANFVSSATPPSADYQVTATLRIVSIISGSQPWVAGRMNTGNTACYVARLIANSASSFSIDLVRFDTAFGGTIISTTAVTTPVAGSEHTITLRMLGNQITGIYDSGAVTTGPVTDNTYAAAGRAGIGSFNGWTATTGTHFESVTASTLGAAAAPQIIIEQLSVAVRRAGFY